MILYVTKNNKIIINKFDVINETYYGNKYHEIDFRQKSVNKISDHKKNIVFGINKEKLFFFNNINRKFVEIFSIKPNKFSDFFIYDQSNVVVSDKNFILLYNFSKYLKNELKYVYKFDSNISEMHYHKLSKIFFIKFFNKNRIDMWKVNDKNLVYINTCNLYDCNSLNLSNQKMEFFMYNEKKEILLLYDLFGNVKSKIKIDILSNNKKKLYSNFVKWFDTNSFLLTTSKSSLDLYDFRIKSKVSSIYLNTEKITHLETSNNSERFNFNFFYVDKAKLLNVFDIRNYKNILSINARNTIKNIFIN
ncbi:hypothetical protein (nucleomorph) [Guillardia theta]|uniref:Uncharacterized protein n=1 Tax=Guillardia theta TaxID=55529 RepID=Q98RQ1_GUITH|nr:hypothetical protein GTHECHR1102 [Guillardia theta]AAK39895.1 hypothetical protein [Guillardia theta]